MFFSCPVDSSIRNNDENVQKLSSDTPNDRHKRVQDEEETDYLQPMVKRQKLYDNAIKRPQYELGDLVSSQIDRDDQINTTPKIFIFKAISSHSSSNDCVMYKLCIMKGVVSILSGVQDPLRGNPAR